VQPLRIVTTSWDDGHPFDLRIAEVLRARGMCGTFYIPIHYERRRRMDAAAIRALHAEGFEIGGHGLLHVPLPKLDPALLSVESSACKQILAHIVGEEIRTFCYPFGRYDADVIRSLKGIGYESSRTTRMLSTGFDFDPFLMPTTVQAFPHTRVAYLRNIARGRNLRDLPTSVATMNRVAGWADLAKALFDRVDREGGVWHLYGHSWEIEKLGLWDELKAVLDYVSKRDDVYYVTNRDVLKFLPRFHASELPARDLFAT